MVHTARYEILPRFGRERGGRHRKREGKAGPSPYPSALTQPREGGFDLFLFLQDICEGVKGSRPVRQKKGEEAAAAAAEEEEDLRDSLRVPDPAMASCSRDSSSAFASFSQFSRIRQKTKKKKKKKKKKRRRRRNCVQFADERNNRSKTQTLLLLLLQFFCFSFLLQFLSLDFCDFSLFESSLSVCVPVLLQRARRGSKSVHAIRGRGKSRWKCGAEIICRRL
jgi:hypothetical protein